MAEKTLFRVEVNGIEMETEKQEMETFDVLKLAEKHGAIPGKWDEYILKGDKRGYGQDDWVDLSEDNSFITLRDRPTQVACLGDIRCL